MGDRSISLEVALEVSSEGTPRMASSSLSSTDLGTLRKSFPHLAQRVYLDTAAAGLTWAGHGAAVAFFYDQIKSRGYDARPEWWAMTQRVRARLAALLRVTPADLTLVSNTTEGLNLAAHSLRFEAGDQLVLAADEFPSVANIWAPALRDGAELVRVPVPQEHGREDALRAALDALPRARLLVVSQVHSSTGTTLDLMRLGRHCRARGVLLAVDGMQALGAVDTDLALVDVYASSFFKWMLSGFGVGVLVTSAAARARMEPAYRGYANQDDPKQLQYAHVNIPAMYGLDATLDFFEGIGWPRVHRRVRELGDHLVAEADRRGLPLVTPPSARAGIFIVRCRDGEAARLALSQRDISVSARGQGVRISPHFYNSTEDVDQCLAALCELDL